MTRDEAIQRIRLKLDLPIDQSEKAARIQFQNDVIRPILKFQNDLLIQYFLSYSVRKKKDLFALSKNKQTAFIDNSLSNDQNLKQFYTGMIIGLFTSDEYEIYSKDNREYNKRIITMLSERIRDQILEKSTDL